MDALTLDFFSFRAIFLKIDALADSLHTKASLSFDPNSSGGVFSGFMLSLAVNNGSIIVRFNDGAGSVEYSKPQLNFCTTIDFGYINTIPNFEAALRTALLWDENDNPHDFAVLNDDVLGHHKITLIRNDGKLAQTFQIPCPEPILWGADNQGVAVPSMCSDGKCGLCMSRIISGQIEQSDQSFLSEYQIMAGHVMLCCATAKSDCVIALSQ
jgi:ferredoxin